MPVLVLRREEEEEKEEEQDGEEERATDMLDVVQCWDSWLIYTLYNHS